MERTLNDWINVYYKKLSSCMVIISSLQEPDREPLKELNQLSVKLIEAHNAKLHEVIDKYNSLARHCRRMQHRITELESICKENNINTAKENETKD